MKKKKLYNKLINTFNLLFIIISYQSRRSIIEGRRRKNVCLSLLIGYEYCF